MLKRSTEALEAAVCPEAELLLYCARSNLNPAEQARLKGLLQAELNWEHLINLAARHGLTPLLYWNLNRIASEAVPRPILAHLWAYFELNAQRNQGLTTELLGLLRLLETNGIQALPYKGPALAVQLYGHVALREFCDLDILVRRQQVLAAKALLLAEGYQPLFALAPAQEVARLQAKTQHHLQLIHPETEVMVELHWQLGNSYFSFPVGDEAWWARLGLMPLEGVTVRCLNPTELLLSLCQHGARHYWASLSWLADVAHLLHRQPQFDWPWLQRTTEQMVAERMVGLGLLLAHRLLAAPLPASIQAWLQADPGLDPMAARLSHALFQAAPAQPGAFGRLLLDLYLLKTLPRQVAYSLAIVAKPSLVEWNQWSLPGYLAFLYHPLRLLRLIGKHGRQWRRPKAERCLGLKP